MGNDNAKTKKKQEKETQYSAIKHWFLAGNTLTSMEAIEMFGCTRLADKVYSLRKEGMIIAVDRCEGKTRYGTNVVYARYKLIGFQKGAEIK